MFTKFLTVAAGVGFAASAQAQEAHLGPDHNQIVGVRGEAHGSVSRFGVFGAGARAELPVATNGLLGGVNDEVALSLGGDVFFAELDPDFYDSGLYLVPLVALQWNFYLGQDWSIFPELGVAFHIDPDGLGWGDRQAVYMTPDIGFGARYHFSSRNALLLRAASPGGVQVGLTF